MNHCRMRQVEERHVANQVDLMVWSNRLDLLAISNFKGEVQIHRLHWQKVWNFPPPKENTTVRAMAWRPDGKAIAIGYSTGCVYIVDIEDKEVLEKYDLELETSEYFDDAKIYGITCITWAVREGTLNSATEYNIYEDPSIFLQKPPSFSNGFPKQDTDDQVKDFKEIQEPTQLNMLVVGYGTGYVYMSIFGTYPYGTIHLAQVAKDECGEYRVLDICMSDDFSMMQVFYQDRTSKIIFVALINTSVISAYAEEMFVVANKHSQVLQLLSYLDQTMIFITEAWENILLEMDNKMANYAASVPEGGVSADLLELLMMGVPSDELEIFLLQDLTAKGLKKFGSSVELSYSTIQRLVLKQLNIVGQSLIYYLAEIRGLTRIPDRFKILGIEENLVTEAIKACCAFLNKCLELQQVIDASMRNYKAFFRWLFVAIVRLLDEIMPSSDIVKITQQELTHIAEFLYNFDNVQTSDESESPDKPVKFNLERLGQYLQDSDLTILPDNEDNPWHTFLKDNACILNESETIFNMSEFRKYSLVQQQRYLREAIYRVFDVADKDIGRNFSILFNIKCFEDKNATHNEDSLRVSQTFDPAHQRFLVAFTHTNSDEGIRFVSADVKEKACNSSAVKYYFTSKLLQNTLENIDELRMAILDLQFYSPDYLSVLTTQPHDEESTVFIQLPLKNAIDHSMEFNIKCKTCIFTDSISRINISPLLDESVYKILEKMDGFRIAVSGGRKVAVVLSKSHRKVRVFEMEADGEDEQDETLDTTPQSQGAGGDIGTPDKKSIEEDSSANCHNVSY